MPRPTKRAYCAASAVGKMRPREPRGFQRFHPFSRNPNVYNNLGNLLSLTKQTQPLEKMEFGHSFGTVEKQERYYDMSRCSKNRVRLSYPNALCMWVLGHLMMI